MKILVTGHKGYIGSCLVPLLLERDHSVFGLDSDLFEACTFIDALVDVSEFDCDVRDVTAEMLVGFDAIIHLAGLSNDPLGDYDPALTAEINRDATIRMAEMAKSVGVGRFRLAAFCSNY